jgi:hypothetical protein
VHCLIIDADDRGHSGQWLTGRALHRGDNLSIGPRQHYLLKVAILSVSADT